MQITEEFINNQKNFYSRQCLEERDNILEAYPGLAENKSKLEWMSRYMFGHEQYERMGGWSSLVSESTIPTQLYAQPYNTMGMGDISAAQPISGYQVNTGLGGTGADFSNQRHGSGDAPMSTLSMSMEIAAYTVGFDLLPVVPASGPWAMVSYNDYPYTGRRSGQYTGLGNNEMFTDGRGPADANKPMYIKFDDYSLGMNNTDADDSDINSNDLKLLIRTQGATVTLFSGTCRLKGYYLGYSRIDGYMIIKVAYAINADAGADPAESDIDWSDNSINVSISDIFKNGIDRWKVVLADSGEVYERSFGGSAILIRPELVTTIADHIQSFANPFQFDQKPGKFNDEPMTRGENEAVIGNSIGARMFTKMVQMGAYEVTGSLTRQQLQDMPLYGIDVQGGLLNAMQNEVMQAINNRIMDRVFRLGVVNAEVQYRVQGANLNLNLSNTTKTMAEFHCAGAYRDLIDKYPTYSDPDKASIFSGVSVPSSFVIGGKTGHQLTETYHRAQRRIASRILAASNLIANTSRQGGANWVVCNYQILSALQDVSQFTETPFMNTLNPAGSNMLYNAGQLYAGIQVYCDPYMPWDDTRICVGRKAGVSGNKVSAVGTVFMPFILADVVQVVAEGTMAPKYLVNSRFAIVDCGFHPEQGYYTLCVETPENGLI